MVRRTSTKFRVWVAQQIIINTLLLGERARKPANSQHRCTSIHLGAEEKSTFAGRAAVAYNFAQVFRLSVMEEGKWGCRRLPSTSWLAAAISRDEVARCCRRARLAATSPAPSYARASRRLAAPESISHIITKNWPDLESGALHLAWRALFTPCRPPQHIYTN